MTTYRHITAILIGVLLAVVVPAPGAIRVLLIKDVPETARCYHYETVSSFFYSFDYWLNPARFLSDEFQVDTIGWDRCAQLNGREDLKDYELVILWDVPGCMTDNRKWDYSLDYRTMDILRPEFCDALKSFVQKGGGLLVAGGAMNYGDAFQQFFESQTREKKKYYGYHGLSLCEVLPVEVPNGPTLTRYLETKDSIAENGSGFLVGLNFAEQKHEAFHKVAVRPGAEVLLSTKNGLPLVAIMKFGKGRVGCVMLCPKANVLARPATTNDPVWPGEAILWERLARWAADAGKPEDKKAETQAKLRYEKMASPPEPVPVEWLRQQYPYLTTPLYDTTPLQSARVTSLFYKYLQDYRFTGISPQFFAVKDSMPWLWPAMKENNLLYIPELLLESMRVTAAKANIPMEEWAARYPDGAFAMHFAEEMPTPYSPVTKKLFLDKLEKDMEALGPPTPWLMGAFLNCEEWCFWLPFSPEHGVAGFNKYDIEFYKQKTGREPPKIEWRKPGVIPEDDPVLMWLDAVRMRPFARVFNAQKEVFKKKYPDTVLTSYAGPYEECLDIITEESYYHMWREGDLKMFNRIDSRYAFVNDMQGLRTRVLPTIGMLIVPEVKSIKPEVLRLNVGILLGRGANAGMHLWHTANLWAPHYQFGGHDRLETEAMRIGKYLHKYGAIYANLIRPDLPVWCYTSEMFASAADHFQLFPLLPGEKGTPDRFWRMMQIEAVAAPALYRAQVPAQGVTEIQLMSPELMKKKAVFIPGIAYMREAVYKNLQKFIRQGGLVFTDRSAKIKIPGAIELPFDFSVWHDAVNTGKRDVSLYSEKAYDEQFDLRERMTDNAVPVVAEYVAKRIPIEFSTDSKDCVTSLMLNGDAKYLFVYNLRRSEAADYSVSLRQRFASVYDINAGKRVSPRSKGDLFQMPVSLEAGGWKVFLLSDQKPEELRIEGVSMEKGTLRALITMMDGDGKPFSAALPLEITLRMKGGKTWTVYRATNQGTFQLDLPKVPDGMNLESVAVRELVTGMKARSKLPVAA